MSVENLIKEALANLRNPATDSLSLVEQLLNQALAEPEQPEPGEFCPECGSIDTKIFVDKLNYGTGDVFAPLHECNECHFKWSDWVSDEVYEKNKAEIDRLTAKNKQQTKRIEELKKALGDFGTHHATCDRSLFSLKLVHTGVCDCGLEQALKEKEQKSTRAQEQRK